MSDLIRDLYAQYPGLQRYGVQIMDSTANGTDWRGQPYSGRKLEFYPPDEEYNPNPGKPTIEVFSNEMTSKDALGEVFSHFLPAVDPIFKAARSKFIASIDPEQKKMLSGDYEQQVRSGVYPKGQEPTFDQWLNTNGGDAFFRGYATDQYPKNFYRADQISTFTPLMAALRTPSQVPKMNGAPNLDRLQQALIAADAAGDTAAAYDLAQAVRGALAEQQRNSRQAKNPEEYDPTSPEYQARYGAVSGMNAGQRGLAGAGKAYMDIGRGAKQLTGNMTRAEVDERQAQDAPLMQTTAGKVGNIGGNVAIAAPAMFIPGANTYVGAAAIGAGLGALTPVGTNDSRTLNMAMGAGGAMAGKFGGDLVSRWASRPYIPPQVSQQLGADAQAAGSASVGASESAAQTAVNAAPELRVSGGGPNFGSVGDDASAGLSAAQRRVMQQGQAIGMRATPGQATGSRALQQMEAKLESQPMTSGPFNALKAGNARVLNRSAAASIGEVADSVDSAVLDRAAQRISNVFEDAADDVPRAIDPQQFLERYTSIQDSVDGLVEGFGDHPLVAKLVKFATKGGADGEQLQSLTSKLGKAAYKNMTTPSGDRDLGMALYEVKDYVDDLLQQGMTGQRAATFQQARGQYRNLMLLTSRSSVVNPSTGNVSGRSLANVLQMKDKAGFTYGRNTTPMYNAARFAQAFQPIVGDSGTATRMPFSGMADIAMRVPMSIASRAYTSSPAVNLALRTQAAAQATSRMTGPASNAMRGVLGTVPYYAPYEFPVVGGLLGAHAAGE